MANTSIISAVPKRLEGKVALITGGASGIGEATARLFSRHGAKVVVADVHQGDLDLPSATFVHCDVTKEEDVENAVNAAVAEYGRLDIMFNNAGIVGEAKTVISESERSDFERVIGVNVIGAFLGTKHAARAMIPNRSGSIIGTASVASVMGGFASYSYTCSKHALVGLTKNAAAELGRYGIRVNCLSPYLVMTPMAEEFFRLIGKDASIFHANLKGRVLKAEDIANAALYLGSDDSQCVSGHNLLVDGGATIAYNAASSAISE